MVSLPAFGMVFLPQIPSTGNGQIPGCKFILSVANHAKNQNERELQGVDEVWFKPWQFIDSYHRVATLCFAWTPSRLGGVARRATERMSSPVTLVEYAFQA